MENHSKMTSFKLPNDNLHAFLKITKRLTEAVSIWKSL